MLDAIKQTNDEELINVPKSCECMLQELPAQTFGLGGGRVTLGSVTTIGCQPDETQVFSGDHRQITYFFL